ncbi:MAG: carboxypeptidase-like regulatory domain-containing protein [bacterium]
MPLKKNLFIYGVFLFLFTYVINAHASVSILMKMMPIGTEAREYVIPGEKFTLSFELLDVGALEEIGGIAVDLVFDNELCAITPNLDVIISPDIDDKKTLYKNLIEENKLRVLLIGFNDKIIPRGSHLFTAAFKVIKRPAVVPGTIIYNHASSSTVSAVGLTTTGNNIYIPIFETPPLLSHITGKVTNSQTGQGIPGVLVGLINENRPDIFYQTLTDSFGNYTISNLIEGTYTLLALKDGYSASMDKGLSFVHGNTLTKNISISAGTIDFGFIYPARSVEEPFVTSLPFIRVYGIADTTIFSIAVKGKYLDNYTPGDYIWNNEIYLSPGENLISATAYDKNGKSLDNARIMVNRTSEDNFKINIPTENEAYESSQSPISIGGITTIYTAIIYLILNGKETTVSDYTAGDTVWKTNVTLQEGANFLDFIARRADESLVGKDSIAINYNPSTPTVDHIIITRPTTGDYYKTGQSSINIGGQTPADTHSITMNDTPLSGYIPGSTIWTAQSVTLLEGAGNLFTFKAFDANGESLGIAYITIEYDPDYTGEETFKITLPSEDASYTHTAESPLITIGGTSRASTYEIRLNGIPISGYQPGETSWSASYSLESGTNQITAVAYNAEYQEIGSDTIAITFILSFGSMKITQPDEGSFQTTKRKVHIGGQTDIRTHEIMMNESLIPEYEAGSSSWSYEATIYIGENSFVFTAYDSNKNIIGRDEITITNPGVLKITGPTENDNYTTEKKNLRLYGEVSVAEPITTTIKINGKSLLDYNEASPYWSYETELSYSENDFYVLAYDDDSDTLPIGLDFVKVVYREIIDPPCFQIIHPSDDPAIVKENNLIIEGDTPSATRMIYQLKDEKRIGISYTTGDIYWSDSVDLQIGQNVARYEAVDPYEDVIGRVNLLIICTGVMRITEPVSNTIYYQTDDEEIDITLQVDTPGVTLLINNAPLAGYSGQSIIHYSANLEEEQNNFEFILLDSFGEKTGYSLLIVTKSTYNNKSAIGSCFIESISFSL